LQQATMHYEYVLAIDAVVSGLGRSGLQFSVDLTAAPWLKLDTANARYAGRGGCCWLGGPVVGGQG
jgi:hypothetical protein